MSGVILRCPNCGTTQAGTGECEACHGAQVAYYCTNHSPGHWLKAPICAQCGARFGEAASNARTPASTQPPPVTPKRQPARGSDPSSSWIRSAPSRPYPGSVPPSTATSSSIPIHEDSGAVERKAMSRRLRNILIRGPSGRHPEIRRPETLDPLPPRNVAAGLVRRLVMLTFFFFAAMFLLSLLAGGPLLQILFNILLNS